MSSESLVQDQQVTKPGKVQSFFRAVFGNASNGYVCIATIKQKTRKFEEAFFAWPKDEEAMLHYVEQHQTGYNVYFCPQLLSERKRKKEHVKVCPSAWSDLDTCPPEKLLVKPSIVVRSSPGRWQGYWVFEEPAEPGIAEEISKRIALHHAEDGADQSGWDLTQLLRVPFTYNYKYDTPQSVIIEQAGRGRYRFSDFDSYPPLGNIASDYDAELPTELPDYKDLVENLVANGKTKLLDLANVELAPDDDWSTALWSYEMKCFEAGMDAPSVFVLATKAKFNKYARDNIDPHQLWVEVLKAEAKHKENEALTSGAMPTSPGAAKCVLLTDPQRELAQNSSGFVNEYIRYGKMIGDAAVQYHEGIAFFILSTVLADKVQINYSAYEGGLRPNLYMWILGETTRHRKSTAMKLGVGMIDQTSRIKPFTQATEEGLLKAVAANDSAVTLYFSDEITSVLRKVVGKKHMADFLESITLMYDGGSFSKRMASQVVEADKPTLCWLGGGIGSTIGELLDISHIESGFFPRIIPILAPKLPKGYRSRPMKLATPETRELGQKLISNVQAVIDLYAPKASGTKVNLSSTRFDVTPEAEDLIYKFSALMEDYAEAVDPKFFTPMMARLHVSGVKMSLLLAASRMRATPIIEAEDVIEAFYYIEKWIPYSSVMYERIKMSASEQQLDEIVEMIHEKPGITRNEVMRKMRLWNRNGAEIFQTLEQRGQIKQVMHGKSSQLFPRGRN